MFQPCKDINKSVPYFLDIKEDLKNNNESINEYIYRTMYDISTQKVDLTDKSVVVDNLDLIPDGALTVNTASSEKIKYTLQIND